MMLTKRYFALIPAVLPVLFLASCATQTQTNKPVRHGNVQVTESTTIVRPAPVIVPPNKVVKPAPAPKASYSSFADWKADFTTRAIASGYNSADVQRLLGSASLNQQVISLDSGQPEFSKMPWDYADSAVSDARVNTGRSKFAEQRAYLSTLESRYGVNAEIIAAIWGMESA